MYLANQKIKIKNTFLLVFIIFINSCTDKNEMNRLDQYNVSWSTPGNISNNSMPAGNGDIGINIWVEEKGDVVFYLSKTDAWSENARLLKLGCIRLSLSPNPFQPGMNYRQELQLKDGIIKIEAGDKTDQVEIVVWVDANHPVVEIDVKSRQPVNVKVKIDIWRNQRRQLIGDEIHSAYGLSGESGPGVFVEPDTVLTGEEHELIWMHRNRRSVWSDNLKLQALGEWAESHDDPLINRTFGGVIQCNKMKHESNTTLYTGKTETEFSVSVYALTAQTETIEEWTGLLKKTIQQTEETPREERLSSHRDWWRTFWERSYIYLSSDDSTARENTHALNQGYVLQRYMNACSGRGRFPIKFNGSIFTVDTKNLKGKYEGYDADYRQWGGPYWWQNTRLPYWSMLAAGDFDLMKSLFKMYFDALPIRKMATQKYYEHAGAFFPETMYFWGTYVNSNYGIDRTGKPDGLTDNGYIRRYWQGGLEISLMMLDYYAYTGNEVFVNDTLVPFVSEILKFFDQHWERDKNGKIHFDPAQSLETWWQAVNPLPEIVGIEKVASGMLNLPQQITTLEQRSSWKKMINDLPDLPLREENGQKLLAPADSYSEKRNSENTELYAIFPYRKFGVGKSDLEIARRTFSSRIHKVTGGWQQSAIQSAYLGLADEAADLIAQNFTVVPKHYRFPAMWGPNYDWTPDQCHGTVAMTALQRMLIQCDGEKIYLFPAWYKDWDVDFKLYAPFNTIVEGSVIQGEIVKLRVDPEYRRDDVEIMF